MENIRRREWLDCIIMMTGDEPHFLPVIAFLSSTKKYLLHVLWVFLLHLLDLYLFWVLCAVNRMFARSLVRCCEYVAYGCLHEVCESVKQESTFEQQQKRQLMMSGVEAERCERQRIIRDRRSDTHHCGESAKHQCRDTSSDFPSCNRKLMWVHLFALFEGRQTFVCPVVLVFADPFVQTIMRRRQRANGQVTQCRYKISYSWHSPLTLCVPASVWVCLCFPLTRGCRQEDKRRWLGQVVTVGC